MPRKKPAEVTRAEFIAALFPAETINVTSPVLGQPCVVVSTPWRERDEQNPPWPPKAYQERGRYGEELYANWATCKAVEHTRAGNIFIEPRATNEAFDKQYFVMLDDIGNSEKSVMPPDDPRVKAATWLMETSEDNYQVGYRLAEPIGPEDNARLRAALIAAKLGDAGSLQNPQRWCRVPGSMNVKPGRNGWRSQLVKWHPERTFTLDELAGLLQIDLNVEVPKKHNGAHGPVELPDDIEKYQDVNFHWMRTLPQGALGSIVGNHDDKGFFPIICPWAAEREQPHSDGDSRAHYAPGYGDQAPAFKCFHSHGKDKSTGTGKYGTDEFAAWCKQQREVQDVDAVNATKANDISDLFSTTAQIAAEKHEQRGQFVEDTLQIGCTLAHGKSKGGKSWVLMDMADHIAHGKESFLGRAVTQARVLYVGAEDTPHRFADRIKVMGIRTSDQLVTMNREQLKAFGERCRLLDGKGSPMPWTPETLIEVLHAQTDAKVIVLDTQEVVEVTLGIEHGGRNDSLTRIHYMSTSSYDEVAQKLGVAVVLVAHWGAIRSLQLAVTNPHEMINTTKTKIAGALTSITLGPLAGQELNDDSGQMQWSVQGKDIRTGSRYEAVQRDPATQRHTLLGSAHDVHLRESLQELMEALETLLAERGADAWVTSKELAEVLGMRSDTVRKKIVAIEKNGKEQATRKGRSDGHVVWKGRVLKSSPKGYRLEK